MTNTTEHSVLLIDDQRFTYEGVTAVLAMEPGFWLLEHISKPEQAVEMAARHQPDLALVDICMPGCNGVCVVRALSKAVPQCRVLALSAYDNACLVQQMLDAGARGYVLKSRLGVDLIDALHSVLAGGTFLKGF